MEEQTWQELAAVSKKALEEFLGEYEGKGNVGFERLKTLGEIDYFRQMAADGEPFDFHPDDLKAEIARLTPVVEVPVPEFVAHVFEHWDEWRKDNGEGVLMILPVNPNFTHGERWVSHDPNDPRVIVESRAPEAFNLNTVPRYDYQWDPERQLYHVSGADRPWRMSDGYWSDKRLPHYQYGHENYEVEVNGEIRHMVEEGFDGYPWNVVACTIPMQSVTVRMRAKGIHTCMSDQYPEDGEWSERMRITHAYSFVQVPLVFNTVFPDAAYGRNFSARLDHVTTITPDLPLS